MLVRSSWRQVVLAAAVGVGGALLGTGFAATRAEAAAEPAAATFHWSCIWLDECGPGSKECCYDSSQGGGHTHCSTNCPIVVS